MGYSFKDCDDAEANKTNFFLCHWLKVGLLAHNKRASQSEKRAKNKSDLESPALMILGVETAKNHESNGIAQITCASDLDSENRPTMGFDASGSRMKNLTIHVLNPFLRRHVIA